MQSRLPVSKPLALVVIGLIIGVSLGLGSGYAVFYPDMVNQRSKTVEERIDDIEYNVSALDARLAAVNENIAQINENLEGILALTDVINQINSRVSTLENGQLTQNNDINALESQLALIDDDLVLLENSWEAMLQEYNDLETAYDSVNDELEDIQALVRENDGIKILTAYIANPPSSFEQTVAVEIFNVLVEEEPNFNDWVTLYGENTAKILLQQEVDAIAGSLVWNPTSNTEIGTNTYQVKLETYFTMEFSPAKVTVNNMHMEIKATIGIKDGSVSGLQITLVEVM